MSEHPKLSLPHGAIRTILSRSRHLLNPRPAATDLPSALPGNEIPEWGVDRGRQELEDMLNVARRRSQP